MSSTMHNAQMIVAALRGKQQMPFPGNNNPTTDFVNRFPSLPPTGIVNDLKPPIGGPPDLMRKLPQ